ncbi:MAG: fumarate hydratase, partial [Candidatus Omnitrophica bacterium]|nr:fumarate hydratase [Candidatus Omnitrophota bacterium]
MRTITKQTITNAIARLIVEASERLPADVVRAIKKAERTEKSPRAKRILAAILENARIARRDRVPICQDTGLAVIFCELGNDVRIKGGTLEEAIQDGIRKGSRIGRLRQSVVHHPIKRKNTGTNSPGVIHIK